jgi:pimeloyl-ACP methyl ester carboxylesterase
MLSHSLYAIAFRTMMDNPALPIRSVDTRLGWVSVSLLLLAGCTSVPTTGTKLTPDGVLAYSVTGSGYPVVVLQSGLGDGRDPWAAVVSKLARSHTVFAYDRPGYGESSSTNGPRDPCTIASELHGLLASAGVPPPYVLVGHSLGGLYQYAFARLYPSEVAGLVLLDPTHPHHWDRMQVDAPTAAALVRGLRATVFTSAMVREFDDQGKCLQELTALPPLHKPTRLLTRSRFELLELGAFENMVRTLEPDWMAMTGAARLERVEGSRHYIQKDRPPRVVAAIEAVASESSCLAQPSASCGATDRTTSKQR